MFQGMHIRLHGAIVKRHSSENASANLIPQRPQIFIIQSHQPHPTIKLQSELESGLRHLQLAQDRIAAGQIAVHQSVDGMLLDRLQKNSFARHTARRVSCSASAAVRRGCLAASVAFSKGAHYRAG